MHDGEQILHRPIKCQRGCEIIAEHQKDQWHEHEDALLYGIACLWRDRHLPKHSARHHQRQDIYRYRAQREHSVRLRQILHPEELAVAQLHRRTKHRVEAKEDRYLHQHWEAAAKRIHAIVFIELHHLLVHPRGIVFILGANLGHLGRERGHLTHGPGGFVLQRPQSELDA